jgi:hypothetical protein
MQIETTMSDQHYRPKRRHRQNCAFGYLTVAPIDGHLGPRRPHDEHELPSNRVDGVDSGREPDRPVPVVRRITRRVIEEVE